MPNIKSAKKRVKVTETKTLQNRMVKGKLKAALKAFDLAVANDAADKAVVGAAAMKAIDQAAAKGVIHKNKASRKKAQVALKLK